MLMDPRTWGLRNKILGASALVTIVVGLLLTWQSNQRIADMAEDQLRVMGRDAGANFASKADRQLPCCWAMWPGLSSPCSAT